VSEVHPPIVVSAIDTVMGLVTPEVIAERPQWSRDLFSTSFGADPNLAAGMDLAAHVAKMDAADIGHALLFTLKAGPGWDLLSDRMDPRHVIAAVGDFPTRFSGLAGLDPTEGVAGLRELKRLVTEHGFVGAHAYPHWFGTTLTDRRWYPYYATCAELGVPIQIQMGNCLVYTSDRPLRSVGFPEDLDVIACDFPELRFVGIHTGWPWVPQLIAVAKEHDNVWIGTDAYAPAYWDPALVEYIRGEGRTKVVFGTDYPVIDQARARRDIAAMNLPDDVLVRFLRDNAAELYGLEDRLLTPTSPAHVFQPEGHGDTDD
jgi:predicted TIM-barrel fold metal-dependent hydrolase